jgi:hypothetical protein
MCRGGRGRHGQVCCCGAHHPERIRVVGAPPLLCCHWHVILVAPSLVCHGGGCPPACRPCPCHPYHPSPWHTPCPSPSLSSFPSSSLPYPHHPSLPLIILSHPSSSAYLSLPPLVVVLGVLGTVVVVVVVVVVAIPFSSLSVLLSWFYIPVLINSIGLILIFVIHVTS